MELKFTLKFIWNIFIGSVVIGLCNSVHLYTNYANQLKEMFYLHKLTVSEINAMVVFPNSNLTDILFLVSFHLPHYQIWQPVKLNSEKPLILRSVILSTCRLLCSTSGNPSVATRDHRKSLLVLLIRTKTINFFFGIELPVKF